MKQKLIRFLTDKGFRFGILAARNMLPFMTDRQVLEKLYWYRMGEKLNLEDPKTFNEKLQWLKLYDRRPEYTRMVDKYEVKQYVADLIGQEYVIPTLGVWDRFDEIDFDALPNQFVLKCTHDSGGLVICRDKSRLDKAAAKKKIEKSLKQNYFYLGREWPYKNVKPRIIAEKYMEESESTNAEHNLNVYKVFNFAGIPEIFQVIQNDKQPTETIDYFDVEWNLLELKQNYPNSREKIKKPEQLSELLSLAARLSSGIPYVRTDFYIVNKRIYFSEYTFFSDSGLAKFSPVTWDWILGEKISLPGRKI